MIATQSKQMLEKEKRKSQKVEREVAEEEINIQNTESGIDRSLE